MNKKILIIFIVLISAFLFSAKIIYPRDPDYYYNYFQSNLYNSDFPDGNFLQITLPLKYSDRISINYSLTEGDKWYGSRGVSDILFRQFWERNSDIIDISFVSNFRNNVYFKFSGNFTVSDTAYIESGNKSILNFDPGKDLGLDFPKESYLSINEDKWWMILGRNKNSRGPMKYDTLFSDNALYYDNISGGIKSEKSFISYFMLSSEPFLTNTEYLTYFNNKINFEAWRNDFILNYEYRNGNYMLGLNRLDHVGGRFPDLMDVFTLNSSMSSVYAELSGFLKLYGEISHRKKKNLFSFSGGFKKDFNIFNDFYGEIYGEIYRIPDGMYSGVFPYDNLYYREFSLSNSPGARIMFDYPFGFIYGENSSVNSLGATFFSNKSYINFLYDSGTNKFGKINNLKIYASADLKYFNFILDYQSLAVGDKQMTELNLSAVFTVLMGLDW